MELNNEKINPQKRKKNTTNSKKNIFQELVLNWIIVKVI